ncbi:MAG: hypothetical protein RSD49_21475 [Hafnia sp.]
MFLQGMWVFIRIVLFFVIMLIVEWTVPYDNLVENVLSTHVSLADADKIAKLIWGAPDLEPYNAITQCISLLINTLLSVPLMSIIISAFNAITGRTTPAGLPKEWALSTLRRFAKIFLFTFLFWALLRVLPYEALFPADEPYSSITAAVAVSFNLLLAVVGYRLMAKIIKSVSKIQVS